MPTFVLVIVGSVVGGVLLAASVVALMQSFGLGAERHDPVETNERDTPF